MAPPNPGRRCWLHNTVDAEVRRGEGGEGGIHHSNVAAPFGGLAKGGDRRQACPLGHGQGCRCHFSWTGITGRPAQRVLPRPGKGHGWHACVVEGLSARGPEPRWQTSKAGASSRTPKGFASVGKEEGRGIWRPAGAGLLPGDIQDGESERMGEASRKGAGGREGRRMGWAECPRGF